MDTAALVRQMTDNAASINVIMDLLLACGHNRDDILAGILTIAEDPNVTRRVVRVPYPITDEESVGLDQMIFGLDSTS